MADRRVTHVAELNHADRRSDSRLSESSSALDLLTFLSQQISDMRTELAEHVRDEELTLQTLTSAMLKDAFPEGDPVGHRKHHEAVIRQAEARAEFWKDMAKSVSRWGILGFLGWIGYTAWAAFVKGPP